MAFRWQKPDYRIGNNNTSTYDPIKHNAEMPHTRNMYYKNKMDSRDTPHDDVRNKMAAAVDPLPLDDDYDYFDGGKQQQQTYRDDPRYGSAHGRSRAAHNREQTPSVNDFGGGDYSYHSYNDNSARKGYQDHEGGISDPRTGNNNAYAMGPFKARLKHGGALLFIRFPTGSGPGRTDNIGVASQAFLRSKTSDMGGKFLGIAKSVYDFGYSSGQRDAIGVYHFPNPEKAKLFFQYDMTIRQPDFPPPYGHAEIWIVSNAYLPDNLEEYNTFLMSEVLLHQGRDKREFFETFQKPFERYLSQNGAMPYIVCSYGSYDRECLRRHAYPHNAIITCHLFKGLHHLRWLTDQDMYMKFRSLHNQMADERCTVFTIQRDLCP